MKSKVLLATLAFAFGAGTTQAQPTLVIYDDALQNGFLDWSWVDPPGDLNLSSTAAVHSGTHAIHFRAHSWQGVSFHWPGAALTTAQWPELRLWVRGTAGGEQLQVSLQQDATLVAQANLAGFVGGGSIAAGQYRLATIRFTDPPLNFNGSFNRINITDASGNAPAAPQVVYLDTLTLRGEGGPDPIFANGFEGAGASGLVITRDVAIDGITGDRFEWKDSGGLTRSAVLAHNNGGTAAGGSRGGELREFRYQTPQGQRHVRAPATGAGGFGYVVAHPQSHDHCTGGGDSSSLGHFTPGQFQRVFEGRHHAILRFTQAYPRYCTRNAPAQQYNLPVTIDWLIANGRDHPLWSITWDMSAIPVNRLEDDARAPYGELLFDGATSFATASTIAGVGWGDRYRFATTTAPFTFNSHWTWNQPNTVPYVKLWTSAVDATMGTVATQTITQQDAGGYWGTTRWNTTSAAGNACASPNHRMPCDYNWPFQSINYSIYPFNPDQATNSTRLAWGTNFGFLGGQTYDTHGYLGTASGWPKKNYSTYIVLGTHSADPVGAQVSQVEASQGLALTATTGSVVASGPSGVNDATVRTYTPSGYDPVYGALRFNASGNQLTANIAVGAGTLRNPLLIIGNYTGALPTTLRLNGQMLVRDQDWLPSLRAGSQQVWITLRRDLTGATNSLQLQP